MRQVLAVLGVSEWQVRVMCLTQEFRLIDQNRDYQGVSSGAIEKCLPYFPEIARLRPDEPIAICVWKCMKARVGGMALSPINHNNTS